MLKKFWISLLLISTLMMSGIPLANAATSILPSFNNGDGAECELTDEMREGINGGSAEYQTLIAGAGGVDAGANFLACALKLGYIRFWMIPFYVLYALQFVVALAGLIAVLMVVLGGYYYVAGGITDDKEKGKTIIAYALGGFVVVLTSWVVVNIILIALTS